MSKKYLDNSGLSYFWGKINSKKQNTIDASHKLSADLVNDTSTTNKFVSASDKTTWNGKYSKPSGGIPSSDMTSAVQTSLGKADTALQSISSSDVTTALGYTPYNSTNPNGYTSNTGTITGITMNGSSKGTSGVVNLGTVPTDVKINGTSILSNNVANIVTNTAYNSSTNKIATMNDLANKVASSTITNIVTCTTAEYNASSKDSNTIYLLTD